MTFRLPIELVERVDAARGDVTRTRFVERALEAALSGTDEEAPASGAASSRVGAASPRTSMPGRGSPSPSLRRFMGDDR